MRPCYINTTSPMKHIITTVTIMMNSTTPHITPTTMPIVAPELRLPIIESNGNQVHVDRTYWSHHCH